MALFTKKPKETVIYQKGVIKIVAYDKPQEYNGKESITWAVIGDKKFPIDSYKELGKYIYLKEPATSGKRRMLKGEYIDTTMHHTRILDVEDGFPLCEDPAQVRIYKDAFIVRKETFSDRPDSLDKTYTITPIEEVYNFEGEKLGEYYRARDGYWSEYESSYLRSKYIYNDTEMNERIRSFALDMKELGSQSPEWDRLIKRPEGVDFDYYSDQSIFVEGLLAVEESEGYCYYVNKDYQRIDENHFEGAWQFGIVYPGIGHLGHGYVDHEGYYNYDCVRFDYVTNKFEVGDFSKYGICHLLREGKSYIRDMAGNTVEYVAKDYTFEELPQEFMKRATDLYKFVNGELQLEDLDPAYFSDEKFVKAVEDYAKKNIICSVVNYNDFIGDEATNKGYNLCNKRVLFKDIVEGICYKGAQKENIVRDLMRFFKLTEEQAKDITDKLEQSLSIIEEKKNSIETENE